MRQTPRPAALSRARALLKRVSALRNQRESGGGGPCRALHVLDKSAEAIAFGIADTNRRVKHLFCDLNHAVEQRAASRDHDAADQLPVPPEISAFVGPGNRTSS